MNWNSGNVILNGLYSRSIYQITVANSFIANASDAAIAKFSGSDATNIKFYRAEARFLRAYQYSVLMDSVCQSAFHNRIESDWYCISSPTNFEGKIFFLCGI